MELRAWPKEGEGRGSAGRGGGERAVGRGEVPTRERTPCPDSPMEQHYEETGCCLCWLDMSKGKKKQTCKFYSRVVSGKKSGSGYDLRNRLLHLSKLLLTRE